MGRGVFEISFFIGLFFIQLTFGYQILQQKSTQNLAGGMSNPSERQAWEKLMLADPETGEIPRDYLIHEKQFISDLNASRSTHRDNLEWNWAGPKNVGGRTRALQIDQRNDQIILAGGASGGIFRSTDAGQTWTKVSSKDQNLAITSLAQNPNPGSEDEWYACTGELRGGTQISGNSSFKGDGILKSSDNGLTWQQLGSISNPSPQSSDSTDHGWRILVAKTSSDVYFASSAGIHKSSDGGNSWTLVIGRITSNSGYTDIIQGKNGTLYATANGTSGAITGLYRSLDGSNWVHVSGANIPANTGRMVLAIDNQFPGERLFILAETPGQGKTGFNFRGSAEQHSLYRYVYLSGDGSGTGGQWNNLSANLPVGPHLFDDYISQSAYCMDIAVSPHDSNVVVIGGTNLYISTDAFQSDSMTAFAGGYGETTVLPDFQVYDNHHPDLQTILFHPTDKNVLYTGSDGGIHCTANLYASPVVWTSLNNGYATTQFYTVAIDPAGSNKRIMGGTQDNGTYLNVDGDSKKNWTMPLSYDGGFCSFSKSEPYIYASKQLDGIAKIELDPQGKRITWKRIDPDTNLTYLFINPYMLDPMNNNVMYLPVANQLMVNDKLQDFIPDGTFDKQKANWKHIILSSGFQPSAIAAHESGSPTVYLGSTTGRILKITDPTGSPVVTDISNGIDGKGYINSISINPSNQNQILVVFSNYNSYSIFITENAGDSWENISGNLEGTPIDGIPPGFEHINNGPSCRVGKILALNDHTTYLVGTSVGLFQTAAIDSMNTQWTQMASESIQNNVVSDIKYRQEDGYLVVATFGAGIFTSQVEYYSQISNVNPLNEQEQIMTVYPNPCDRQVNIQVGENIKDNKFMMYNLKGELVLTGQIENSGIINTTKLSSGVYVLKVVGESGKLYQNRLLKN